MPLPYSGTTGKNRSSWILRLRATTKTMSLLSLSTKGTGEQFLKQITRYYGGETPFTKHLVNLLSVTRTSILCLKVALRHWLVTRLQYPCLPLDLPGSPAKKICFGSTKFLIELHTTLSCHRVHGLLCARPKSGCERPCLKKSGARDILPSWKILLRHLP